jgi:uncharacterized membrane protein YdbT with pleckstrin-like domain
MSYARSLLSRGEEVVFESRQHWFAIIGRTWLWIAVTIVAVAVLITASTDPGLPFAEILQIAGAVSLLIALARIGLVIWGWRNQEYLVTTRRILKAEGILNKHVADSSLEKVNDARLRQSVIGRIFGYGTLDILTAAEDIGGDGVEDFPMMADAVPFKIAMLNQKELLGRPELAQPRWQRSTAPEMQRAEAMPPRAGSDRVQQVQAEAAVVSSAATGSSPRSDSDAIADTLERLAGLRDRGLITAEEYEGKKRQLLERL